MGEDSSELYVPTDRYPTKLGALRAIHRSLWFTEAQNDGWDYEWRRFQVIDCHPHGPEDGEYENEYGELICHQEPIECHVFVVTA